jgi:flagellar biosynthesis protein
MTPFDDHKPGSPSSHDNPATDADLVPTKSREQFAAEALAIAREHGIPIRQDQALAAVLSDLDLSPYVPHEMYRAVAEVLSWVYHAETVRR